MIPGQWMGYLNFTPSNANGTGLSLHHYNNSHAFIKYYQNMYLIPNGSNGSDQGRGLILLPDRKVIINGIVKYNLNEDYTYIHQGYQLTVNGGILCEEVKIINDVPNSDFVFEDNYSLLPLDSVSKFIIKNKHLPGVPSAAQFKKDGYKIGEMDDILLRKIEELTLYILKLEARLKELEQKN